MPKQLVYSASPLGKYTALVIHQDHVEGFIGHYDRIGLHIEKRFV
jgi:hypothetical protein